MNTSVFSPEVQNLSGFADLVAAINQSQILVDQLNEMPQNSVVITPNNGPGTYATGSILTFLPSGQGNPGIDVSQSTLTNMLGTANFGELAALIGHEAGHVTQYGGYGWTGDAPLTPEQAANAEAANEGVALVNEYNISLQEGVAMPSGAGAEAAIEGAMLADVNSGNVSQIQADEQAAATNYVGDNLHSSVAPQMTYNQYGQDYFAAFKEGVDPNAVDWSDVSQANFSVSRLLNAQTSLAGAKKQRIQALTDWRTARLELAGTLGRLGMWSVSLD